MKVGAWNIFAKLMAGAIKEGRMDELLSVVPLALWTLALAIPLYLHTQARGQVPLVDSNYPVSYCGRHGPYLDNRVFKMACGSDSRASVLV